MYGIPHGWGANLLMYNSDVVKPAPTSWKAVFDARPRVLRQGDGLRQPDLHRRRRAVSDEHPAGPRDREPVRARRGAARRCGRRPEDQKEPSASTGRITCKEIDAFKSGASRDRHVVAGQSPVWPRPTLPSVRRFSPKKARPAGPTPGWWPPTPSTRTAPTCGSTGSPSPEMCRRRSPSGSVRRRPT